MPVATRKSALVDRNGRAMSIGLLYKSGRNDRAYRPRPILSPDTRQNVTEYDRMDLVNLSTQLVAQVDILATAIEQKNNWAFGDAWDAHFSGSSEDAAFAEEAKNFLDFQFYPNCNRRGPQFDMRTSMKLMGRAWDVAGDDLAILTETDNHFPQFALYPSTRVATYSRSKEKSLRDGDTILGGPFDGAKIFDGVILNRDNRIVGVRLINDDGEHTDISAFNADLAFEPAWCDQVRGIPRIAVSLLRWLSIQDIDQYIQDGIKRASKMAFRVVNTEGDAAVGNEVITDNESDASPTASDSNNTVAGGMASERRLHYEEVAGGGGEILYHAEGEDIEYVKYENPHPNSEAFIERIQRGSLASVGWFYELLNLNEGGRAPSRLLCDLANQTITDRQATGRRRWKRIITYALAKAAKHGFIRKPKDPRSFGRWEPGYPKQISVDAGNDIKASLDLIKFGLSTVSIEAAKLGYHVDFIRAAQQKELFGVVEDADRIFALVKSKGVTYQECLQMVRQTNPNPGNSQPQSADGSPSSGAKSHEVKISIDNKTDKPAAKRQMELIRDATGKVTGLQER